MHRRELLTALGAAGLLGFNREAAAAPRQGAPAFNGLTTGVGDLPRLSRARSRSISPENFTGEKGGGGRATTGTGERAARDLGPGWKISPSVRIAAGDLFTLAQIEGPGAIQHIWMTPTGNWRFSILRIYWDGETTPSIEAPVGDFFASGWGRYAPDQLAGHRRQSRQRVQQLLDDAVPPVVPHHAGEHRRRGHDALLSDRPHTTRRSPTMRRTCTRSSGA